MKVKFKIPNSTKIVVRWFRNNTAHDVTIPRPANNEMLRLEMLKQGVGYSEIKAVKACRDSLPATKTDLLSLATKFQ